MPSIRISRHIVGRDDLERLVRVEQTACGALTIAAQKADHPVFPVEISARCTCGRHWEVWSTEPLSDRSWVAIQSELDTDHSFHYD